jgi:hypothetical protein
VSCHHLAPDLAHLYDKSTIVGIPLGGLPSTFSRQEEIQLGSGEELLAEAAGEEGVAGARFRASAGKKPPKPEDGGLA